MHAGQRLGPYEILEKLGEGGMGEVYRAHDTRLDRDVAIKVLSASVATDADRLQRFAQEARAASALNHPNILTVHDVGTHERTPYLVTELLEGTDLRTLMNAGSIAERRAVDYALQIASALAAAHEKGIVHRDLKPENVFVTPDHRIDTWMFPLEGGNATALKALQSEANEGAPALSPSGRWVAYASDESGRYEIYVQRFPDGGGKRQISTMGALSPLWSADRRELFFHGLDGTLMSVAVSDAESFSAGTPQPLFEFRTAGTLMTPYYSVTPDGKRFLLSATVEVDGSAPLTVVVNWTNLLRSTAPAP